MHNEVKTIINLNKLLNKKMCILNTVKQKKAIVEYIIDYEKRLKKIFDKYINGSDISLDLINKSLIKMLKDRGIKYKINSTNKEDVSSFVIKESNSKFSIVLNNNIKDFCMQRYYISYEIIVILLEDMLPKNITFESNTIVSYTNNYSDKFLIEIDNFINSIIKGFYIPTASIDECIMFAKSVNEKKYLDELNRIYNLPSFLIN